MKVFIIPIIEGKIADEKAVELEAVADYIAYGTAMEVHKDATYVEKMLDGEGYINLPIPGGHAILRYKQHVWQEDQK